MGKIRGLFTLASSAAIAIPLSMGAAQAATPANDDACQTATHCVQADATQIIDTGAADTNIVSTSLWDTGTFSSASFDQDNPYAFPAFDGNSDSEKWQRYAQAGAPVTPTASDATVSAASVTAPATATSVSALNAGPVTFFAPWMLLGLLTLPLLWWLMRTVPPKPVIEKFPAIKMLFNLKSEDQEPSVMPLWQRLLRLTAAGLIVLGLADPRLNPDTPFEGNDSVLILVDNGWASAADWSARQDQLERLITQAESERKNVIILPTAPNADGTNIRHSGELTAKDARQYIKTLVPQPWNVDREATLQALKDLNGASDRSVIWLSNGLGDGFTGELAERLDELGPLSLIESTGNDAPHLLLPPSLTGDKLSLTVKRADSEQAETITLVALDETGNAVTQIDVPFTEGESETNAVFTLPIEVRNEIARISIKGETTAAATILLDERWKRRPVGIIDDSRAETAQPLLNEISYIERALSPYADIRQGSPSELFDRQLAVLIMTDSATLTQSTEDKVKEWVENGGTLLRFAGPRLASEEREEGPLMPVETRKGERIIGTRLSGETTGRLAPFEQGSPFFGLTLPENVTIQREVLAQPSQNTEERTWARLQDGTPLVTARQQGEGWVVLIHTTANTDWSNLAISGLFVDMLRTVVNHSQGVSGSLTANNATIPPYQLMDGQGQLGTPAPTTQPLDRAAIENATISPQTPPGYYGTQDARHAHNLGPAIGNLEAIAGLPEGTTRETYETASEETKLKGAALGAALALMIADMFVVLGQRGALPGVGRRRRRTPATKP